MSSVTRLHDRIAAVCPIDGVSADGRIDFRTEATAEHRAAAVAILAAFDPATPTIADYQAAIQAHVDGVAQAKGYDSGTSISGYVNSTVSAWAAEAQAFIAWRDSVWAYAYQELTKVQEGQRPQPSVYDLIAELPAIAW